MSFVLGLKQDIRTISGDQRAEYMHVMTRRKCKIELLLNPDETAHKHLVSLLVELIDHTVKDVGDLAGEKAGNTA
jgi:hypothetical protein